MAEGRTFRGNPFGSHCAIATDERLGGMNVAKSPTESSGAYLARVEEMVRFAEQSRTVEERLLWCSFVTQYLDNLIDLGKPSELSSGESESAAAMLIAAKLLTSNSPARDSVATWVKLATMRAQGCERKEAFVLVSLVAPSLESPLAWDDSSEVLRINSLFEMLEDRKTMWAIIDAYEGSGDALGKIRADVQRLNEWRASQRLAAIVVNWPELETCLAKR